MEKEFVAPLQGFLPRFYTGLAARRVQHFIRNCEWEFRYVTEEGERMELVGARPTRNLEILREFYAERCFKCQAKSLFKFSQVVLGQNDLFGPHKDASKCMLGLPNQVMFFFRHPKNRHLVETFTQVFADINLLSLEPKLAASELGGILAQLLQFVVCDIELRKVLRWRCNRSKFSLKIYLEKLFQFVRNFHVKFSVIKL